MDEKIYTLEELASIVAPLCASYGLKGATLFGSYALGRATGESDIDIVLKSDAPVKPRCIFEFAGELEQLTGKNIDAYGEHELVNGGLLDAEVKRTGLALC